MLDDENLCIAIDCLDCKHLRDSINNEEMPTCDAFPQGIPLDIINGQQSHRIPYAGDSNIRFERIENQRKTKKG
jgi:hypothetical protein